MNDDEGGGDIDGLLDHIERRYLNDLQLQLRLETQCGPSPTSTLKHRPPPEDSELSDLINDIRSATELSAQESEFGQAARHAEASSSSEQQRCFPTYVGGSSVDIGLNTTSCSINQKCCSNLRCIDCDFSVIRVDDQAWHSSIDYLFLRNHMPDIPKLKTQLIAKRGYRAYACQCAWRSVDQLTDVKSDPTLKWICGKH